MKASDGTSHLSCPSSPNEILKRYVPAMRWVEKKEKKSEPLLLVTPLIWVRGSSVGRAFADCGGSSAPTRRRMPDSVTLANLTTLLSTATCGVSRWRVRSTSTSASPPSGGRDQESEPSDTALQKQEGAESLAVAVARRLGFVPIPGR